MKKLFLAAIALVLTSSGLARAQGPDDDCPRFWGSADYLLGWVKKGPTPPLVTTGPDSLLFSGSLDIPGTQVLFGGDGLDYGLRSGWKATAGVWLDDQRMIGVEASAFRLEQGSDSFFLSGDANGQPFFGRPFVNALTGNQNVYFVSQNMTDPALSAFMTGSLDIASSSQLWGWEANAILGAARRDCFRADFLAGFRWLDLQEDLRMVENLRNLQAGGGVNFLGTNVDPSQSATTIDEFDARNRFYGGQVGGRVEWQRGRFTLGLLGKVALGVTHQEIDINGASLLLNNAGVVIATAPGGVQAVTSNIGRTSKDQFSVVPEIGVNVAFNITSALRAHAGYTFLYWSNVARPGDQIDFAINPGLVPTDATFGQTALPLRPAATGNNSDFWMQTLNLGLELRF